MAKLCWFHKLKENGMFTLQISYLLSWVRSWVRSPLSGRNGKLGESIVQLKRFGYDAE